MSGDNPDSYGKMGANAGPDKDCGPRLILGTVQLGLDYGVANKDGQPDFDTAKAMLEAAKACGVNDLDTAAAYGNSEEVIGRFGADQFNIMTKLPPFDETEEIDEGTVRSAFEASLTRLGCERVHAVLVHRATDLQGDKGLVIARALMDIQASGLARFIGVSVYEEADLVNLPDIFVPDIVQAPGNVLDRRILESDMMKALKAKGTELHIRSAFLQGLLLQEPDARHPYFSGFADMLDLYDTRIKETGSSRVGACLSFLRELPVIDAVVFGADSPDQLRQTVNMFRTAPDFPGDGLASIETGLLDPRYWDIS